MDKMQQQSLLWISLAAMVGCAGLLYIAFHQPTSQATEAADSLAHHAMPSHAAHQSQSHNRAVNALRQMDKMGCH